MTIHHALSICFHFTFDLSVLKFSISFAKHLRCSVNKVDTKMKWIGALINTGLVQKLLNVT